LCNYKHDYASAVPRSLPIPSRAHCKRTFAKCTSSPASAREFEESFPAFTRHRANTGYGGIRGCSAADKLLGLVCIQDPRCLTRETKRASRRRLVLSALIRRCGTCVCRVAAMAKEETRACFIAWFQANGIAHMARQRLIYLREHLRAYETVLWGTAGSLTRFSTFRWNPRLENNGTFVRIASLPSSFDCDSFKRNECLTHSRSVRALFAISIMAKNASIGNCQAERDGTRENEFGACRSWRARASVLRGTIWATYVRNMKYRFYWTSPELPSHG